MYRFLLVPLALALLVPGGHAQAEPAYRQEVVIAGSPFQGVHGLAVDGDRLLASNLLGQSVHSVDLRTGAVSTVVGPPLGGADDVAVGADGSIYWTGYFTGRLMRRTPDGKTRVIARDLPGLNSLAFRADGRLYVTQVGRGDALWEVDPAGQKPPRKLHEGIGFLNGFEFGPDDRIYGPRMMTREIIRLDVDSGAIEVVADGFIAPTAVNFDSRRQNLYVTDTSSGALVRVEVATGAREVVAELPSGLDNLAIGPDDRIYISNMIDNDIRVFDPADGSLRHLVESRLSVPAGLFIDPEDPAERLYLADVFALRRVRTSDGRVTKTGRVLSTAMTFPMHVSATAEHLVLSSAFIGNVQVMDRASGNILHTVPNGNGVQGAIELEGGALLIAEAGTGRLVRVDLSGGDASSSVLVSGLGGPVGLIAARDADEPSVYLTEVKAGRVTEVRLSDGRRRVVAKGLRAPEGIAQHPDGSLIVAEVGRKRLLRIDPDTGRRSVIASDLRIGLPENDGLPPGFMPTGVAVGASGTIYMSSDLDSALLRFVPIAP